MKGRERERGGGGGAGRKSFFSELGKFHVIVVRIKDFSQFMECKCKIRSWNSLQKRGFSRN